MAGLALLIRLMRGPLGARLDMLPVPLIEKPYYLVLSRAFVAKQPQLAARLWDAIEQGRTSPAYRQREQDLTTGSGGAH